MNAIAHRANTVREPALKVDSGRKNPFPHRGNKPTLVMCRSDAVPAEPHLHSAIVIITACWLVTEGLQFAVLIPQNTSLSSLPLVWLGITRCDSLPAWLIFLLAVPFVQVALYLFCVSGSLNILICWLLCCCFCCCC